MAAPDPPRRPPSDAGGSGADFVTSGARAPRKPRIEVLQPGSTPASTAGGVEHPQAPREAEPPHEPYRDEPVERMAAPAANRREPLSARDAERGERMRASASETRRTPFRFDSRTLLLALLGLGVLALLFGYISTQRGQEVDEAGTQAAVESESITFPDDTDRYYEPETVGAEQTAPGLTAEDRIVAANAERAPAPGMSVELPSAAPVPAQRRTSAPQPRAEGGQTTPATEADPPGGASAAASNTNALQTVSAFYAALGEGDGASASSLVVPSKRRSGPLSAGELTRYFSSFRRPLRVRSATALDEDTVRVAYDYVLPGGRLCRGQAVVDVVASGERALISRIRSRGPC